MYIICILHTTSTYRHVCIHIHTYTHIHTHIYIYIYTYVYIHIHTYIHISIYIYIYTHLLNIPTVIAIADLEEAMIWPKGSKQEAARASGPPGPRFFGCSPAFLGSC